MRSGEIRLENRWGMHARLAYHVSREALRFASAVRLKRCNEAANAKEVTDLLLLAAGPGDLLLLETDGEDETAAFEALSHFLLNDAKLL